MTDKAFPNLEFCLEGLERGLVLEQGEIVWEAIEELQAARELLQAIMDMQLDGGWPDTPQVSRVVSAIAACQPKEGR